MPNTVRKIASWNTFHEGTVAFLVPMQKQKLSKAFRKHSPPWDNGDEVLEISPSRCILHPSGPQGRTRLFLSNRTLSCWFRVWKLPRKGSWPNRLQSLIRLTLWWDQRRLLTVIMVFGGASKRHCLNSRKMPCQNTILAGTARTIWNVLTVIALVWETGLWKCFVEVLIGTTSRTYWLQCHKNQQETTWPNRVNFDGHISCRNCESQTFATPVWFFSHSGYHRHPHGILRSPQHCSTVCIDLEHSVVLECGICCPLAEATWQLAVWFGLPMRFFGPQNAKLCWGFPSRLASTGKASWSWNRRFFGNSEGAKQVLQGLGTKEMFLQDHIPTIFGCETTPKLLWSSHCRLWMIFWLLKVSLNMLRSNSGVEQGSFQEEANGCSPEILCMYIVLHCLGHQYSWILLRIELLASLQDF